MKLSGILLGLLMVPAATAVAQVPADGYYRVDNHMSGRYIYVLDDKGTIDTGASSAELRAIELWTGHDRTLSDPASVMYFRLAQGSNEFDVTAQGTGIHKIIDYYMKVRAVSSLKDTYLLYATNSSFTKYLADAEAGDCEEGLLSDSGKGTWRYWRVKPIEAQGDNYFGVAPDLAADDAHYASFYAGFPFSVASQGVSAWYVSKVDTGRAIAVISEVSGVVPAETPVIMKCSSADVSANRLDIGGAPAAPVAGNCLKGVYFCNHKYGHVNRVANDRETMRVAAILPDDKLGFVTSDVDYMPRNKAYLSVPAGSPASFTVMTEKEYRETYEAGIDDVIVDTATDSAVYNLHGVKVADSLGEATGLPAGIYVSNHRKFIVK